MEKRFYLLSCMLSVLLFSFCGTDDSSVIPPKKDLNKWSKVLYYKELTVTMDGSVSYLGLLDKEGAEGRDHVRVYYDDSGASIKQEVYDKVGNRINYVTFFYKNRRKVRAEGFNNLDIRIFVKFYSKGRLYKEQLYNELGEPERYHTFSYNNKGNIIEEQVASLLDSEKSKKKYIYDNDNRLIEERFYVVKASEDGLIYYIKREYTKAGKLKFIFIYDNNDYLSSKTYFDDNGDKVKVERYSSNIINYVDEYKRGRRWKATFYKNGKPSYYELYTYDKGGNQVSASTYSMKGKLIR